MTQTELKLMINGVLISKYDNKFKIEKLVNEINTHVSEVIGEDLPEPKTKEETRLENQGWWEVVNDEKSLQRKRGGLK